MKIAIRAGANRFRQNDVSEHWARVALYQELREAKSTLKRLPNKEPVVEELVDHQHKPATLSTKSKTTNDEYQCERRRVETAARWRNVQQIVGWAGVLFCKWMPAKWFNVTRVYKGDWLLITQQLLLAQPKRHSVIMEEIPISNHE